MVFIQKNLILSSDEKDNLIEKLKSALIALTGNESIAEQIESANNDLNDIKLKQDEIASRDQLKQRKIDGLLKLIQEKIHK